jgi:hypothetical protein
MRGGRHTRRLAWGRGLLALGLVMTAWGLAQAADPVPPIALVTWTKAQYPVQYEEGRDQEEQQR